jgi:hypothetical protein
MVSGFTFNTSDAENGKGVEIFRKMTKFLVKKFFEGGGGSTSV